MIYELFSRSTSIPRGLSAYRRVQRLSNVVASAGQLQRFYNKKLVRFLSVGTRNPQDLFSIFFSFKTLNPNPQFKIINTGCENVNSFPLGRRKLNDTYKRTIHPMSDNFNGKPQKKVTAELFICKASSSFKLASH